MIPFAEECDHLTAEFPKYKQVLGYYWHRHTVLEKSRPLWNDTTDAKYTND